MELIGNIFASIFLFCKGLINNYWLAIVLFTFISKIILLPISIIVQKNSIKMVQMYPDINRIKTKFFGNKEMISEKQYELYKEKNYKPLLDIIPALVQLVILMGVVAGFPKESTNDSILLTLAAALSSFILCFVQNRQNVLQSEQSKINKIGVMLLSIALSIFLALFVSKYVVFYWICSNLMSAGQIFILNYFINPKKYIDYNDLKQSKEELNVIIERSKKNKKNRSKDLINREKRDYKRFIKYENKQIVFYSEKNGFYKYYKDIIEIILKKTDIIIHYISSDPDDEIFRFTCDNFQTYYIDEKIMVLMMQMDADIVVMTTPDLQNYYIKRSMVRDDIEYIYIDHATNSINLSYHKDALAYYDTVFVQNYKVYEELRAQEEKYGFKKKNLVKVGCSLIDNMIKEYKSNNNTEKTILLAPSWQEDNILDLCIDDLLKELLKTDYKIILRPHPQYIKLYSDRYNLLKERYSDTDNLVFQDDFSSNSTVYDADILITDWSGIALEYSFTTLKPAIYINTPMKVINQDYKDINITPFDIEVRSKIGIEIDPNKLNTLNEKINKLSLPKYNKNNIKHIRDSYLYNVGSSAKYSAKYIIDSLIIKYQDFNSQKKEKTKEIKCDVENKIDFKKKFKLSLIVNLFTCLTLLFFSPMEVYIGNYSDFVFPINNVWWIMMLYALCVAIIASIVISFLPYKISKSLNMFVLLLGLLCYIQIVFLNYDVNSLAATNEVENFSIYTKVINAIVWLIIIHFFSIYYFNNIRFNTIFNKLSIFLSAFLIFIQLFGFIVNCVKLNQYPNENYYLSSKGEFELSSKDNTVIFIFDYCDWDYMNEAINKYPTIFNELDGFTLYSDFTTTYNRTYPSVPYLLTGEHCYYDIPWQEYINTAWNNSRLINKLHNNGTNIGIYDNPEFVGVSAENIIDNYCILNSYNLDFINPKILIKMMTILSAYRCSPYVIKPYIMNYFSIDVNKAANLPNDYCVYEDDPVFYQELKNNGLTKNNDYTKAFRFYHLLSTHKYMSVDFEMGNHSDSPAADTIFADFKIINLYIEEMKRLNIYDNSTIIITTDHGNVSKKVNDGEAVSGFLLIKQPYEKGETKKSNLKACHDDLFGVIYDGKNINEFVNIEIDDYKKRYINITLIGETELTRYMIDGDSRDYNNWHKLDSKDIKYSRYAIKKVEE